MFNTIIQAVGNHIAVRSYIKIIIPVNTVNEIKYIL